MKGYLLDTYALLTFMDDETRLSDAAQAVFADPSARVLASAASIFEVAVKKAMKRVRIPDNFPDAIAASGIEILPIGAEHAWKTLRLPFLHPDPYDRLLIAQGLCEDLTIVTNNPIFEQYRAAILRA